VIRLSAPYPTLETVTLLPNPEFGDSEALRDTVQIRRAMDGTTYSYVRRTGGRRQLQYDFNLGRMKALELIAFVRSYQASKIQLTDHLDQVWVGNLTVNPMELETALRSPTSPGRERVSVRLEFEGVKQ
jgi:hypothetical protein